MAPDTCEGEIVDQVRDIAIRLGPLEGPLLPILHEVQERFGHVPHEALPAIAEVLNRTAAEIHGVMSFYHEFRTRPAGRRVVRLCRAEACKAMGADALADEMQRRLGIGWGETAGDGAVTLEPVFCLGLCACAPAAMLDGAVLGRVDADLLSRAIAEGNE
ncbi:formate dehydrogenase subunit gamma [Tropicimonas sp.]|uniref:formate dehydrogenase subunit gamma n=1 Tax=Tropicimonas sp. TaxID=2067044 RepID=UPI003A895C27